MRDKGRMSNERIDFLQFGQRVKDVVQVGNTFTEG